MFFTGCNAVKNVPKGKQLLTKNTIKVNHKQVNDATAKSVLRQKPNKQVDVPFTELVLWRPYLMLYNWGNPEKEKGFGHWLTKIGEAPVILDSALVLNSAKQLGQYYYNNGYFLNEVEFKIDFRKDSTLADVTYNIYAGPQYYFNHIEYIISSPGIVEVVNTVKDQSLIKAGQTYSTKLLEEERDRLVLSLRNNGYYGFPKNIVRFEADTSAGDHGVNVKLIVGDKPSSVGDSIFYIEHLPYAIKNIYLNPTFSFSTNELAPLDTAIYKSITITQKLPIKYKANFLESQVHFKPGEFYSEQKVKESYRHLTGNRVFRIAEINFETVTGDTTNALNAFIKLEPFDKRTFSAELEGTNTAGNYGVAGVITMATRNFFKGGEIVDVSFRGGLEAQVNVQDNNSVFNTKELGVELGVNFPRFLFFGGLNQRIAKRMEPKSRVFTSYSYQTRVEFERTILAFGLLYNWRESNTKFHQINLVDINYVHLPRINQDYLNSLEFKTGFQDNLIAATRYTFQYDNQKVTKERASQFFKFSAETAGNMLAALNNNGNFAQDEETEQYLVLGVPYAQYVKFDVDFRNYINLTDEHQFVYRAFLGTTFNYGNTPFLPPFEKSFLAGGSNDIRGWTAYNLGPGNFPSYLYNSSTSNYSAVAPLKLMANAEYRFPILKAFKGAIFLDAGNIWIWDRSYTSAGASEVELALINKGVFKIDQFYKQLATNTGIGLRYDFGFFAFRLDMGMKIWDPTEPINYRYVLPGLRWNNITYNIALGYPF